jgi:hypothetical protein
MTFLKYFFAIVGGALAASVLGGAFACVVALISPELVATLFSRQASAAGESLVRYAAAVGMIGESFSAQPSWHSHFFSSLSSMRFASSEGRLICKAQTDEPLAISHLHEDQGS